MPAFSDVHPEFRLGGNYFNREGLREIGYSLVKEGEAFEQEIGDFILDWVSDSPEVMVTTSGSTGSPGTYRLLKQHMLQSAIATGRFFELSPGNTALLCLPARYIAGKMMLVRAMVLGLSLDYTEPGSDPLLNISRNYDFCAMVPAQFFKSVNQVNNIQKLIIGGAPLGKEGIELARNLHTEVYETFGMTETISHIAIRRMNPPESTFKTLPNVKVDLDERGCLVIDAPDIGVETLQTNDLVRLTSTTEFEWLGRLDHVVNSGGIKLVPEKIEEKLRQAISSRYFITGLPDTEFGQKLVLVLESVNPPPDLLDKLKSLKTLASYEVPREIIAVRQFKGTGSGKVNRPATLKSIGIDTQTIF